MTGTLAILRVLAPAIKDRLSQARDLAQDANRALEQANMNLCIGTLMGLDTLLPEIEALYRTMLAIHHSPNRKEVN